MKKFPISVLILVVFFLTQHLKAQEIHPYISLGLVNTPLADTETAVRKSLEASGFEVIGQYHPENNQTLSVIAYSRKDLQKITLMVKDRGALAAALKIGLKADGPETRISYLNPEYLFQAYLGDEFDNHAKELNNISEDIRSALTPLGSEHKGFGGGITAEKLRKYHYKIMMPYFSDPVELAEFSSFEEGVNTIERNLKSKKGNTELVYRLKFNDQETAVYGIGYLDPEKGESHFLPIIGESHLAAMPYEIILQGKKATMLHGRYRIALHWPELTMGTFMKIMSTPGDYNEVFEAICQ